MTKDSVLRSDDTSLLYQVVEIAHWSTIKNVSNPNDIDHVKWYGSNSAGKPAYVSNSTGRSFVLLKE
jgi:hypothetical protein